MSGHSKWSKVKHQKATTDVLKSAAFTRAARGIMIAVKEGGGITDPAMNFHLRLAMEKARAVNMPKENIVRALERAKGADAGNLHQISYEGYGPFGVAFYIEATTDNVNRTVSFIKQTLEHAGGSMATPGAVGYLFDRQGVILVPKTVPSDTLLENALETGALDVVETKDMFELYTNPKTVFEIKAQLEEKQIPIHSSLLVMRPKVVMSLPLEKQEVIDTLMERLEESDDIQHVFTNS